MRQRGGRVRAEWGPRGARGCQPGEIAVVVDVLSFTTTLTVALDAGIDVYPYPFRDDSAQDLARRHDAVLAAGRFEARLHGTGAAVSLSPASVRAAAGLTRIVLPSPNGSALARALRDRGVIVVGAALRNRLAVARWIAQSLAADAAQPITVVPAGERWPDGSLRPAVEDLWGAGAVVAALTGMGVGGPDAGGQQCRSCLRGRRRGPGQRARCLRLRAGAHRGRVRR